MAHVPRRRGNGEMTGRQRVSGQEAERARPERSAVQGRVRPMGDPTRGRQGDKLENELPHARQERGEGSEQGVGRPRSRR
jgi:hypothetical protein